LRISDLGSTDRGAATPQSARSGDRVKEVQHGPPSDEAARLRATAKQLEGVFVEQLFKAMRETVPDGGFLSGGAGEEIFTGMLDQQFASVAPEQWQTRGLAEALYRQLRSQLQASSNSDPAPQGLPHVMEK
jgi:peptidoglycan hydrolase FlgJ